MTVDREPWIVCEEFSLSWDVRNGKRIAVKSLKGLEKA